MFPKPPPMLIIGIILGILISIASTYLLSGWKSPVRKVEVPVTYKVDWWLFRDRLEVTGFEVRVLDSTLNLLKTKASVAYTVKGKLKHSHDRKLYIDQVHISEKLIRSEPLEGAEVEFTITPILREKEKRESTAETTAFTFTNVHQINSVAWGKQTFRFICDNFEQNIEMFQRK